MKIKTSFDTKRQAEDYLRARGWKTITPTHQNIFWHPFISNQKRDVRKLKTGKWIAYAY